MRIEIPQLPPSECSPNWRGHWTARNRAGRVYHNAVFYCCVDARNRAMKWGRPFPLLKARLNLTFIFRENRHRDRDNLLARFKPGLDAIVDSALILDDDAEHLQIGSVDILVDCKEAPRTIIEIEDLQ